MTSQQVIFWFREDLRLTDNPALVEAAKAGSILPLYIFDTNPKNPKPMGAASKWWLKKSLEALQQQGVPLLIQSYCQMLCMEVLRRHFLSPHFWR